MCHIASGDRWAGAEVQLATLLRALARRGDLSLCAIVLNEGCLAAEIRECGIQVNVIPEREENFIGILRKASRYLSNISTDVLHGHGYKANVLAALLAQWLTIPSVVRTEHGLPEPFQGKKRLKQRLARGLDYLVARYATKAVISVTGELAAHLSRQLDPRKVITIHNGIEMQRVHSRLTSEQAKELLGILPGESVVGTAGRLEPIKRLDMFLLTASHLLRTLPKTKFLIVGEGMEEFRLRRLVVDLGIREQVRFLGHRTDIYDVLRAMDVFLLTSDHEGLPMVLLEALNLGLPIVAREVGGIPEVLQGGTNGILVSSATAEALAEACISILSNASQRQRLAKGASDRALDFSAEKTADATCKLYHSVSKR